MIAARPIGPAPTIATVSPGSMRPRGRRPRRPSAGCRRGTAPARPELIGHLVHGRVGERHSRVLGLQPVDQVAEDPAASAGAQAVMALLAEPTAAARRDAGDEHAVALLEGADRAPISTTVPTASWPRTVPGFTSGTSPLRMWRSVPQIVDESIRTIASVGSTILGSGTSSQTRSPGPW